MAFKSLLGMKKGDVKEEGPTKPKMPTLREILEDIDNIKKNDPILTLAAIINKNNTGRHSVVDSDIKELMEALQRRKRRESQTSSVNQSSPHILYSSFKNAKQLKLEEGGHDDNDSHMRKDDDNEDDDEDGDDDRGTRLTYDKLKHFLTTCEHSQELIGTLEGDLKRLQYEVAEHYVRQEQERQQSIRDSDVSNLL